jgi:hypothetical protein
MQTQTEDNTMHWRSQADAQLASIREMVGALTKAIEDNDGDALEEAERAILEDALSVEVRTGWMSANEYFQAVSATGLSQERLSKADLEPFKPAEFRILLCTGGPAVQIIGELSEHGEPEASKIQLQGQDWFQPWQNAVISDEDREALARYAQCFCFGE